MNLKDISADYHKFWGIKGSVFRQPYAEPADLCNDRDLDLFLRRINLTLLNYPCMIWSWAPPGCGKSTVAKFLFQTLPVLRYEAVLVPNANRITSCQDLIEQALEIDLHESRCFDEIKSENRRTVIIIDADDPLCDMLSQNIRETYQAFSDQVSFLILADQDHAQNPILGKLVTNPFPLPVYTIDRTTKLLRHYLDKAGLAHQTFAPEAIHQIHNATDGIPKRSLLIAEQCLIEAYLADTQKVESTIVRAALGQYSEQPQANQAPRITSEGFNSFEMTKPGSSSWPSATFGQPSRQSQPANVEKPVQATPAKAKVIDRQEAGNSDDNDETQTRNERPEKLNMLFKRSANNKKSG